MKNINQYSESILCFPETPYHGINSKAPPLALGEVVVQLDFTHNLPSYGCMWLVSLMEQPLFA